MRAQVFLFCVLANLYGAFSGKLFFKQQASYDVNVFKNNNAGEHWVLLVAGSNEWWNYRHQADVSHAYQLLRKNGIPADRIVTMMYDDIAHNPMNPSPGKIINEPNGPNVYEGVQVDYRQKDVTPQNFLAVLRGDEIAMAGIGNGRVIKSGPNDHVFVNFVDHGGPGILGFPDEELQGVDLLDTIKKMHQDKKYGQMVLYIEACYSGSIFQDLPKDINAYAITAANERESSYACFCDDETYQTCLGDQFSVQWMKDSEKANPKKETLEEQFKIVKDRTERSHVSKYGSNEITKETLDEFQSEKNANVQPSNTNHVEIKRQDDLVASEDVPLAILYRRLDSTNSAEEQKLITDEIKKIIDEKDQVQETMKKIVKKVISVTNHRIEDIYHEKFVVRAYDCYKSVLKTYKEYCFDLNKSNYARKSLWQLVNMCEENILSDVISSAIVDVCQN